MLLAATLGTLAVVIAIAVIVDVVAVRRGRYLPASHYERARRARRRQGSLSRLRR